MIKNNMSFVIDKFGRVAYVCDTVGVIPFTLNYYILIAGPYSTVVRMNSGKGLEYFIRNRWDDSYYNIRDFYWFILSRPDCAYTDDLSQLLEINKVRIGHILRLAPSSLGRKAVRFLKERGYYNG